MTDTRNEITVTEDDLKLVDAANFENPPGLFEFQLDSKRPFGNSSKFKDMCEALGLETVETIRGETVVPAEYKDVLEEQAQKLPYVFEVILQNGRETGHYIRETPHDDWQLQEEYTSEPADMEGENDR